MLWMKKAISSRGYCRDTNGEAFSADAIPAIRCAAGYLWATSWLRGLRYLHSCRTTCLRSGGRAFQQRLQKRAQRNRNWRSSLLTFSGQQPAEQPGRQRKLKATTAAKIAGVRLSAARRDYILAAAYAFSIPSSLKRAQPTAASMTKDICSS